MKKRFTAFALAAALCLGLAVPASAAGFSDVPAGHWAYEQINQMDREGIVTGYNNGAFRPSAQVSYGAFSLMVARAFYKGELTAYHQASGEEYENTEMGRVIIGAHGIWDGTQVEGKPSYSINAMLPRKDMAQIAYNVLRDHGIALPGAGELAAAQGAIRDYGSIAASYREPIAACYALGLLGGRSDGTFGPDADMNRAQAAVVLSRLRAYVQSKGGSAGVVEIPSPPEPEAQPVMDFPEGNNTNYLTNGKPISEENVLELLNQIKQDILTEPAGEEPVHRTE